MIVITNLSRTRAGGNQSEANIISVISPIGSRLLASVEAVRRRSSTSKRKPESSRTLLGADEQRIAERRRGDEHIPPRLGPKGTPLRQVAEGGGPPTRASRRSGAAAVRRLQPTVRPRQARIGCLATARRSSA